ncbi:GGDEF domain-containing protein [Phaeobacter sp. J2-8]|uniref:GGDEF domain-containing protein n=1 Tax=Phaeobacter sp. J2-8 TaxID=2931394 RepID=UPI001FD1F6A4|nr:GGDEF domain-containing protein [Phaeobacter sp. J2-8]MCJ7871892.1 diguanylate cyclase [Phaeobacter sp. J2-8]
MGPNCDMLDMFCPMHLTLDRAGHIAHVGPTLAKLRPDQVLVGQRFLEVFELRRPRSVEAMADLMAHAGTKLNLRFRDGQQTGLVGVLVAPPDFGGGAVINLSFGISVVDAVGDYALTGADFAATDLTIEMLYLVEAKSAAMEASRKLNLRLQGAKIAAEEQAFTDTLTGLKNRRAMDHVLSRAASGGGRFALVHLDLDFFKAVNDTKGHAAGDHVLQEVARILVEETRTEDTVARVGGDEFVLLMSGRMNRKRLARISERLVERLEKPIVFGEDTCQISASIGIVLSEDYAEPDIAQMQDDADFALYASKHRGRACHTFYDLSLRNAAFAGAAPPSSRGDNTTN